MCLNRLKLLCSASIRLDILNCTFVQCLISCFSLYPTLDARIYTRNFQENTSWDTPISVLFIFGFSFSFTCILCSIHWRINVQLIAGGFYRHKPIRLFTITTFAWYFGLFCVCTVSINMHTPRNLASLCIMPFFELEKQGNKADNFIRFIYNLAKMKAKFGNEVKQLDSNQ